MDNTKRLEIQINSIENELVGIYSAQVLHQMKVADAEQKTGIQDVDDQVQKLADQSRGMLAYQERMIAVRTARVAELRAELEAIKPS